MSLFVSPAATSVSGGHVYNAAVLEAWPGTPPEHVRLDGDWPDGPGTCEALAAALTGQDVAIVDGLVGAAHPGVLAAAERAGTDVTLLVHLPLPDETGLLPSRRAELAEREHASVHACTRVVATSRTAAADLERRYGRHDIDVAAPGTRPAPLSTGSTPPLILSLAALVPRKNHETLAAALGLLRHLPWTAVFAGPLTDPEHLECVRRSVSTARVEDRVEVPGEVTGADLEALWSRADVLALPSHAETYGLVVTEAVARGVPVVVGHGTGAVEALRDGDGPDPGISVDVREPPAIAAALATILGDATWGGFARDRRAHLRSWSATAEALSGPARPAPAPRPSDPAHTPTTPEGTP